MAQQSGKLQYLEILEECSIDCGCIMKCVCVCVAYNYLLPLSYN